MDETTGTTGQPNEPVADDSAAAPPSYKDVKNERLIAQYEAANKKLTAIREKPITADTLKEAQDQHKVLTEIAAEMQTRKEASDKLREEMALLTEVVLPEVSDAPATIGDGIDEAAPAVDTPTGEVVDPEKELVAASAGAPSAAQIAAAREPQTAGAKVAATPNRKARAWTAAAGMGEHVRMGADASMADLGVALMEQIRLGSGMRDFPGFKTILASLPGYSEDMGELLGSHNGVETNNRLIAEAQAEWRSRQAGNAPNPKLAAICDPLDIIREISTPGRSRATPFRDSLPFRGAGRLGFQFIRSVAIATTTGGLRLWSDTDQDNIDPSDETTWKPVLDVDCGTPVETTAQELTWGLRFDESTDLSAPERVADILDALMTQEARRSESYLVRRYDQLANGYGYATPNLGGVPDVAEVVARLWEKATYTERIDLGNATLWLPPGFVSALRVDKVSRGFDSMPEKDILAELQNALPENMRIVQLRDISDNSSANPDGAATSVAAESADYGVPLTLTAPGAAATAITHDGCTTFRLRLGWPDQLLAYSTGRTDTGVQRSPELIRQNRSEMFGREWIGLAKTGSVPLFYVNFALMNQGVRMGMVDGSAVDCSS